MFKYNNFYLLFLIYFSVVYFFMLFQFHFYFFMLLLPLPPFKKTYNNWKFNHGFFSPIMANILCYQLNQFCQFSEAFKGEKHWLLWSIIRLIYSDYFSRKSARLSRTLALPRELWTLRNFSLFRHAFILPWFFDVFIFKKIYDYDEKYLKNSFRI